MKTFISNSLKLTLALLLVAVLFGAAGSASAASLPSTQCVARIPTVSDPSTVACDLWATTGSAIIGPTSVNIWGYSAANASGSATLPGPILMVNQGDTVKVTLHNIDIPEVTALLFQGQSMIPDMTGIAAGGTTTYTFLASHPGTFLYEAGLVPGKQHQVAMGLYGALVVKPSTAGTAYDTAATAYDEETVLVLSEFDTTLAASPTTFDMRNYAPKYFLINGKAYTAPFTGDISATAGNKVLLRYVNAGLQSHAMSTLGISQKVIAQDGYALARPHSMITETIATGQTLDALVTIPSSTAPGTKFAIYDANLMLRNSNASGFGGMLTFLTSGGSGVGGGGPDTTGPTVTAIALSPNPTNVTSPVTVSATISDVASGNSNVTAAEFYIDSTSGSPTAMTGVFGTSTVSVAGSISTATLGSLSSGNHSIFVRGQDTLGNWGTFVSIILTLDKTGPATSGLALSPNPSSGAVGVALSATGNDTASGNSDVTAAEYWVDGSAHTTMTASGLASPIRNFTATIPSGLSLGTHIVSVRSQDSFGNWGAVATINLQVADTVAPITSGVSASPNPNNGSKPFNTSVLAVRVTASFSDVTTGNSNLVAAEGFIDTVKANGTGFVFIATDGIFNSPAETGYSDIPLAVVGTLTAGNHTIYVHAKDAAGNWGAMSTTILVIDKTPPTAVSITRASANPTNAASVQFTVNFSEAVTGLTNSNFTLAQIGVTGASIASITNGSATVTVTVNTGSGTGTLGLNLTSTTGVTDLAGNTLSSIGVPMTGATYTVDKTAPTFTGVTINPTSIIQGTASITMAVTGSADSGGSGLANAGEYWFDANAATAFTGTSGVSVATSALSSGAHTLNVRIRDNVGNWSTVRTATLTVNPDTIFSDGFESGNFSSWTSTSTNTTSRLNVTAGAALLGSFGMQSQGNNTNFVQYNFGTAANPVTATFDARFYFNPNNNASTGQDIFRASSGTNNTSFNTPLFSVRYRRNGTQPQVQIQVGATANAAWINISNNASNRIEVVWSGSTLQLYVGGALSQTLSSGAGLVSAFRVGSVTSGGSSTLEFFDAFSAKRSVSSLIVP